MVIVVGFFLVTEHQQYIKQFSEDFERTLKEMIEKGIYQRHETEVDDPLYQECVQHVLFGKTKAQLFHGRHEFLEKVKAIMTEDRNG